MSYVVTPTQGYWIDANAVLTIEQKYDAVYMGYWSIKNSSGSWSDNPVDVFYQPNPDRSQGHTNYFGIFKRQDSLMICNAESAFSEGMYGVELSDGEVLVSRYRHDCVMKSGVMVDGGRDYVRRSGSGVREVMITVNKDQFVMENVKHE